MKLTVHIQHSAEVDEFIKNNPEFASLKNIYVPKDSKHSWTTNNHFWGYHNKTIYKIQVMIIGKTGYGKSSTLNAFVGKKVFETNGVSVCTKDLYCASYRIDQNIPTFFSLCDLPGIGEPNYADNHYYKWYKDMMEKSDVIVYLLRADQRDFVVDEILFKNLLKKPSERLKTILALNYADKIEPINRKRGLSVKQEENLQRKVKEVAKIFNFSESDIIYYSATEGINWRKFSKMITEKLKSTLW